MYCISVTNVLSLLLDTLSCALCLSIHSATLNMGKTSKGRSVFSVSSPRIRVRSRGLLRYKRELNERVLDDRGNGNDTQSLSEPSDEEREFPNRDDESDSELTDEPIAMSERYDRKSTFQTVVFFLKDVQGMTREHQDRMLRHINAKHRSLPDFPSNLYFLDKILEPHYMKTIKHFYCLEHGNYIGETADLSGTVTCGSELCELHLTGREEDRKLCGVFFTISVTESLKMYFESVVGHHAFQDRRPGNNTGSEYDLFDGHEYGKLHLGNDDVSLTFHIDDGQTFGINGSKNGSTKMLSFIINELPSRKRYRHRFLFALAVGKSHPESQMLLDLFSSELSELEKNGLKWIDEKGIPKTTRVMAPLFNSDAQARWDALGISSFHAEFGCTTCLDPGMREHGSRESRKYPADTVIKLRTRRSVVQCAEQALRKGVPVFGVRFATRLLRISSFCPVRGSTHDYMHCVSLGVMKTGLMKNWRKHKKVIFPFASSTANRTELIIGEREERIVDQRMKHFRFPSAFKRTIVSLSRSGESHASEHLNLLLYGFFFCFKDVLPAQLFDNAMDLSLAMHLLLADAPFMPSGSREIMCENARGLLEKFCRIYQEIYGVERMVYNLHQLRHLAQNALDCGPLYHLGCFYFEDFLGREMRSVKGSAALESQMLRKFLQDNFLVRHLNPERDPEYIMGGIDVQRTTHYYLIQGSRINSSTADQVSLELVRELPACLRALQEGTTCFATRLLRDDNILLDCAGSRKTERFDNSFFCLKDGSIVQINIFISDVERKCGVYCVVKKFASQSLRGYRLPDGSSQNFIKKCSRTYERMALSVEKLLRPVVVVLANDFIHAEYAVIPPSLHTIM